MKRLLIFSLSIIIFSCSKNNDLVHKLESKNQVLREQNTEKENTIVELKNIIEKLNSSKIIKENDSLISLVDKQKEALDQLHSTNKDQEEYFKFKMTYLLPENALEVLSSFSNQYKVTEQINPFYIRGNFDQDTITDYAVLIEHLTNQKKGILVIYGKELSKTQILGAGNSFGNGGDNFSWMDAWQPQSSSKVGVGVGSDTAPKFLSKEVISVIKTEAASAVIYWNGKSFDWYQQGD